MPGLWFLCIIRNWHLFQNDSLRKKSLKKYESQGGHASGAEGSGKYGGRKAKTALEVLEKQLQVDGMTCLRRSGTEHHPEMESLDELLVCLQEAYKTLLYEKKSKSGTTAYSAGRLYGIEKAEKDLAKAEEGEQKTGR